MCRLSFPGQRPAKFGRAPDASELGIDIGKWFLYEGRRNASFSQRRRLKHSSRKGAISSKLVTMRNSWVSRIFIGPHGLRSGWGLLIYVLIFAVCVCVQFFATKLLADANPMLVAVQQQAQKAMLGLEAMRPGAMLIIYGTSLAVILFVPCIMSLIERRRFGAYGLGGSHSIRNLAKGLLTGLVLISMLVGLLWVCRLLVFDGVEHAGGQLLSYGLKWFIVYFLVGLSEGYLSLGYLQSTLTRAFSAWFPKNNPLRFPVGFWSAALVLSACFSLGHITHQTESPVGLFTAFLFSVVSAYSLWRTGSLWWSIGVHATWDWGQSFLYGVSDSGVSCQGRLLAAHPAGDPLLSGGLTGPEGSLFAIGILLLGAVLVRFTLPKQPYAQPLPATVRVSPTQGKLA